MNLPQVLWREEPTNDLIEADDPRRDIRTGWAIGFFFFVILLGWAALAPLDAGVLAPGSIAISGNRQAVQSREAGIVGAINVREGQKVKSGEILIELASPDLLATERALTSEYFNLVAQRDRLLAERNGLWNCSACPIPIGCLPSRRWSCNAGNCRRDRDRCRRNHRFSDNARSSLSSSALAMPSSGFRCASSSGSPRRNWSASRTLRKRALHRPTGSVRSNATSRNYVDAKRR